MVGRSRRIPLLTVARHFATISAHDIARLAMSVRGITEMPTPMAAKRTASPPPAPAGPLPTATFHILLALVDGERHGYAIMKDVGEATDNAVKLGAGTLYGALKRLRDAGWIEELDERADPDLGDDRRRYYRLTRDGLAAVRAEARRLGQMVRAAQMKKLIGPKLV